MSRFEVKHLAAFSLITILPLSMGCHISFLQPGVPGSGVSKSETRDIDDFTRIEMMGSGDLNIQCGDETSLTVTMDDNLLELLETTSVDGKLKIGYAESVNPMVTPVFDISTKSLRGIELAGSSKITILDYDDTSLELEVAGSGTFKVVGVTDEVKLHVAGSGRADLSELVAQNVEIEIAGAGSATVNAVKTLDVEVAGSGNIKYIGDPKVTKSIAGAGSVKKLPNPPQTAPKLETGEVDSSSDEAGDESEETSDDDEEED